MIGRCIRCGGRIPIMLGDRKIKKYENKRVWWVGHCSCRDTEYDTFWQSIKNHWKRFWFCKLDRLFKWRRTNANN